MDMQVGDVVRLKKNDFVPVGQLPHYNNHLLFIPPFIWAEVLDVWVAHIDTHRRTLNNDIEPKEIFYFFFLQTRASGIEYYPSIWGSL